MLLFSRFNFTVLENAHDKGDISTHKGANIYKKSIVKDVPTDKLMSYAGLVLNMPLYDVRLQTPLT